MTDRTALVVGADSAVGAATTRTFRREGWAAYAVGPEEDALDVDPPVDEADLRESSDARRVVKWARTNGDVAEGTSAGNQSASRSGDGLDAVVLVPPAGPTGAVAETDPDDAAAALDRVAVGFLRVARAAVPAMREEGDGSIVAVADALGRVPAPGTGGHAAQSAALGALAETLRAEVERDGVDVTTVEPALPALERERPETTDYAWVDDAVADLATLGPSVDAEPGEVAAAVYDAAAATDPAPRYPVGTLASLVGYARLLPPRWRALAWRLARLAG